MSVAIEVVPFIDGGTIVAAQTVSETSVDGSFAALRFPIVTMPFDPTMGFAGFSKVSMTVEEGDSERGEETATSESPHESSGIPATNFGRSPMLGWVSSPQIFVGAFICPACMSTTIVQLCDGKEDRSGDGGGDHEGSGIETIVWGYTTGVGAVSF